MTCLFERIVDGRMRFAERIEERARQLLTGYIERDFESLVAQPLQNPSKKPYFQEKYKKIEGNRFSWNALKNIEDIAGVSTIDHSSIFGSLKQISACVDGYNGQLLEAAASIPAIYMDKTSGIEPNCVGASQIIASLYSFKKPMSNLEMLFILSSRRRDNLLKYLREFDTLPTERSGYQEYVELKVDSFSGHFPKKEARDKLLDAALQIEDTGHVAVRKKGGEIFDFEIERNNFKNVEICPIQEGIWASAVCNLVSLYNYLGFDSENQWKKVSGKVESISSGLAAMINYSLGIGNFNKLQTIFGEDLPSRYYMAEMAKRRTDLQFNSAAIQQIQNTYVHTEALKIVGKKYLSEEDYSILIGSLDSRIFQSPLRRLK